MAELVIGIIIFVCLGLPLLWDLVQTIRGIKQITRKGLCVSQIAGVVFLVLVIVRLVRGAGLAAVSPFDIYFIAEAAVETVIYHRQKHA